MTPHAVAERFEPTVPTTPPRRSLALKLAEVMAELGRIPKRGRNEHFGYDYVMEADIVEAVRQHLSSKQIALLPSLVSERRDGTLTTVTVAFTFADGESGETLTCHWAGTGENKADKGLYVAYTGCVKTFLMKTFLLPTGDDPEQDDKPAAKPTTAARPAAKPAARPAPAVPPQTTGEIFTITKVWPKDDAKRKPCGVVFSDEQKFTTFSETLQKTALDFQKRSMPCVRDVDLSGKYPTLTGLHPAMTTGSMIEDYDAAIQHADEPEWLQDD